MTVNSLKELKKLIQLCRQTSVQSIKVDGIEIYLLPIEAKKKPIISYSPEAAIPVPTYNGIIANNATVDAIDNIKTPDDLTEEQLLMWSAGAEQ